MLTICHNHARNPYAHPWAHDQSAVDNAASPLYLRSNEAGFGGTRDRPQPLLAEETDAAGRAAAVTQPSSRPGQSSRFSGEPNHAWRLVFDVAGWIQRRWAPPTREGWSRRPRGSDHRPAGRNHVTQVALLAVIASLWSFGGGRSRTPGLVVDEWHGGGVSGGGDAVGRAGPAGEGVLRGASRR